MKNVLIWIIIYLSLGLSLVADSSYDRTIEVTDKNRNDKVISVFKEMITLYQDEDARGFLEHVSEDRFLQDYLTFSDAIYQDTKEYDILEINYWINEIVPKGNYKRYLNVRWERYSIHNESAGSFTKKGVSRFLFDDINGEYKLIELAGNNLWGDSLPEWRDEVPSIPGQEEETILQTDLAIKVLSVVNNGLDVSVDVALSNTGDIASTSSFDWSAECNDGSSSSVNFLGTIAVDNPVSDTITFKSDGDCQSVTVMIDSNKDITEKDETNNQDTYTQVQKLDLGVDVLSATYQNSQLDAKIKISNTVINRQRASMRSASFDETLELLAECDDGTKYNFNSDTPIDEGSSVELDIQFAAEYCNELTITLDPNEKIDEANDENNEITYQVDVKSPDLVVTILSANENASDQVDVAFIVRNEGKSTLTKSFEWIAECDGREMENGVYTSDIGINQSKSVSTNFDITGTSCNEVKIIVDSNEEISELDEDNNEDEVKVNQYSAPTSKPDLTVTILNAGASTVDIEINNIGSADAIPTSGYIYWTYDCGFGLQTQQYKGDIAAGDSESETAMVTGMCSGPTTVVVDTNDDVDESDEYNNEDTF